MGMTKITRNFQVTLPSDIRHVKGFKEGDRIIFSIVNDRVCLDKADSGAVQDAAGLWRNEKGVADGLRYERKLRAQWKLRQKREWT